MAAFGFILGLGLMTSSSSKPPVETFRILDDRNSGGGGVDAVIKDDKGSGGPVDNPIKKDL
jgi:hypothetical protein